MGSRGSRKEIERCVDRLRSAGHVIPSLVELGQERKECGRPCLLRLVLSSLRRATQSWPRLTLLKLFPCEWLQVVLYNGLAAGDSDDKGAEECQCWWREDRWARMDGWVGVSRVGVLGQIRSLRRIDTPLPVVRGGRAGEEEVESTDGQAGGAVMEGAWWKGVDRGVRW